MCGIAGMVDTTARTRRADLQQRASTMASRLRHRGPDSAGEWVDEASGVCLGFRRLAIIDRSPTGAQPMVSADGRWVVVFNGEIYNHPQLRKELERAGTDFRGTSDTEVLVEGIARWGLIPTLRRADAMAALAAWDRSERSLHLAVDRFGEKPLYYGWADERFLFGSELDALSVDPDLDRAVDRMAVADLLAYGYIGAPRSIYSAVSKVGPGTVLTLDPGQRAGSPPERQVWWSAAAASDTARGDPPDDPASRLHQALIISVGRRMVADVPVGAFLSGGLDSSLVVALMQEQSSRPVRTFTIGFDRPDYDESSHAREVAGILGTHHTEERLSVRDALELVPRIPELFDEPLADASCLPTYLVSRIARREVTVALAGDGGDELFGGYGRHVAHRWWGRLHRLPTPVVGIAANLARRVPAAAWNRLGRFAGSGMERRLRQARLGEKLEKLVHAADSPHPDVLFERLRSLWPQHGLPVRDLPTDWGANIALLRADLDDSERAMLWDTLDYLPGDVLAKTDRSSMAVSLEARLPFLSPDVYAAAWSMPTDWRAGTGESKRVNRRLLRRYLPERLVDRPKMGFGVPVGDWLRGDLRGWAEDLLSERRLVDGGIIDAVPVRRAWSDHLSGRRDHSQRLWAVCTLQAWLEARHPLKSPVGR